MTVERTVQCVQQYSVAMNGQKDGGAVTCSIHAPDLQNTKEANIRSDPVRLLSCLVPAASPKTPPNKCRLVGGGGASTAASSSTTNSVHFKDNHNAPKRKQVRKQKVYSFRKTSRVKPNQTKPNQTTKFRTTPLFNQKQQTTNNKKNSTTTTTKFSPSLDGYILAHQRVAASVEHPTIVSR